MAKKTVKKTNSNRSKAAPAKTTKKAAASKTTKTTAKSRAKSTVKKTTKTAVKKTAAKTTAKKTTAAKKPVKEAAVPKKTAVKKTSKPKKKIKGYSKTDLKVFKKIILDKRAEIIEQLEALKEQMMDSSTGQYVNENSPYSLHMAEQGTDAQEREKLYLWAQRENKFLAYLEDALQRIELGTYGICIECVDEPKNLCPTCPLIPKERLMAVPHTQHCVEVKNAQSK
ncbi:MAG: conjugal transfer protein TraR [Chlorobi bacterium]|nr:conjugal transfer protein TraR [Chlorobiota bacterium]